MLYSMFRPLDVPITLVGGQLVFYYSDFAKMNIELIDESFDLEAFRDKVFLICSEIIHGVKAEQHEEARQHLKEVVARNYNNLIDLGKIRRKPLCQTK